MTNNTRKDKKADDQNILKLTSSDKYNTVEDLFKKSQPSSVYYTMLLLSSVIVACGLLLGNAPIVIGGMLVTPLLTPILVIALGVSVGEANAIKASSVLVLKSCVIVIAVSLVMAIIFGASAPFSFMIFGDSIRLAALYFIVAFVSGVAATFAWIRKEVGEILPGVAVAVSLVPPLAMLGIHASALNSNALRMTFFIFIFNLIGVILGSMVVFSLLKFHKAEKIVKKEAKEAVEQQATNGKNEQ